MIIVPISSAHVELLPVAAAFVAPLAVRFVKAGRWAVNANQGIWLKRAILHMSHKITSATLADFASIAKTHPGLGTVGG
jgi:hypothetical protein